jgi:hypothetical protein
MTSQIATPEQIIGGLELDPIWLCQPEKVKQALLPFISTAPETLIEHLGKLVTVRTWAETKLAFLKHLLDGGYSEALCEIEKSGDQTIQNNIILMEQLLDGIEELMDLTGQTDRDILAGPSVGLKGLALLMFDRRLLTIADLLKLQPMLLIGSD